MALHCYPHLDYDDDCICMCPHCYDSDTGDCICEICLHGHEEA